MGCDRRGGCACHGLPGTMVFDVGQPQTSATLASWWRTKGYQGRSWFIEVSYRRQKRERRRCAKGCTASAQITTRRGLPITPVASQRVPPLRLVFLAAFAHSVVSSALALC